MTSQFLYIRQTSVTSKLVSMSRQCTTSMQSHTPTSFIILLQWLKWSCEAGGSPDKARLEQPHTHSQPN